LRILKPHAQQHTGMAAKYIPNRHLNTIGATLPHAILVHHLKRCHTLTFFGFVCVFMCSAGKAGAVSLDLSHLDPTGLLGWQVNLHHHQQQQQASEAGGSNSSSSSSSSSLGSLLLLVSPSKRYFRGIQSHINNAVHGVSQVRSRF
jgi:hypothetical protein